MSTTQLETDSAGIKAAIQAVIVSASVSGQSLEAAIQHVLLTAAVSLDPLSRNPLLRDIVMPLDTATLEAIKVLADTVTSAESLQLATSLGKQDFTQALDALVRTVAFVRRFPDTAGAADSGGVYLQNYVQDYVEFDYVGEARSF